MKVTHSITICENDLKRIIAGHFKNIDPNCVSFNVKENFYGESYIVTATIRYDENIDESEKHGSAKVCIPEPVIRK